MQSTVASAHLESWCEEVSPILSSPHTSFLMCGRNGSLPEAAESCKKGTLKLDLQSLTVGVAVVSMGAWLLGARAALLQDTPTSLDAARKLAVVNGLGEHSRAQVCMPAPVQGCFLLQRDA